MPYSRRYKTIDLNSKPKQSCTDIICKALEEDPDWGLVIYRTSYVSSEKWQVFLDITKQRIAHQLKTEEQRSRASDSQAAAQAVAERLTWTIVEDADTLEGADLEKTCRLFLDWSTKEDWREKEGKGAEGGEIFVRKWPTIPKYRYFIHADEAMIESVYQDWSTLDDIDADVGYQWAGGDNHIFLIDVSTLYDQPSDDDDEASLGHHEEKDLGEIDFAVVAEWEEEARRIKGATLLELYVNLLGQKHMLPDQEGEFWELSWS